MVEYSLNSQCTGVPVIELFINFNFIVILMLILKMYDLSGEMS